MNTYVSSCNSKKALNQHQCEVGVDNTALIVRTKTWGKIKKEHKSIIRDELAMRDWLANKDGVSVFNLRIQDLKKLLNSKLMEAGINVHKTGLKPL